MFYKKTLVIVLFILIAGLNYSHVSAGIMNNLHEEKSGELLFSKLGDHTEHVCHLQSTLPGKAFCVCNMKTPPLPYESSSKQKACYLSTECGGFPSGSPSAVLQLNHEKAEPPLANAALSMPSGVVDITGITDFKQEVFNAPYKPPISTL